MKKIIILTILMILIIPFNIKAYELETEGGEYEYSKTIPESGYSYSHTICNGMEIKSENITYNEETKTFEVKGVTEQSSCKFYFNKNGEEIIKNYEVKATVLNGTIEGDTTKIVRSNTNATFTFNPSSGYGSPTVSCTNSQTGTINGDTLTVNNVTNDTTCTVTYKELTGAETIIVKATEGNSEGLIKLDQPETSQTPAQTEYRYSGREDAVKNYVAFNEETWRIIGVFNGKLKLIRDDFIPTVFEDEGVTVGGYATYMTSTKDFFYWNYDGTNNWEEATLKRYLNGTYYNSINIDSKMLINEEKWFLGGIGSNMPQTAREYYETERSNNVYSDNPKFTLSCIGLVYPSDLYYSVNPLPTTFPNIYSNKSWLFNSAWTITSSSENGSIVYNVVETLEDYAADDADNRYAKYAIPYVYPTLYLKENVKIIGGDGTLENMYQLSL